MHLNSRNTLIFNKGRLSFSFHGLNNTSTLIFYASILALVTTALHWIPNARLISVYKKTTGASEVLLPRNKTSEENSAALYGLGNTTETCASTANWIVKDPFLFACHPCHVRLSAAFGDRLWWCRAITAGTPTTAN